MGMAKGKSFLDRIRILDGSMLKLIAVVSMLIDHTSIIILSQFDFATEPFTLFGKSLNLVLIGRYIGRLAFPIFAFLITEGYTHTRNKKRFGIVLLIFAFLSEIPFDIFLSRQTFSLDKQNIYFTLFLGFLGMWLLENIRDDLKRGVLVLLVALSAIVIRCDYSIQGVLLIILLYLLRNQRALASVFSYPCLSGGIAAWCAFIPINLYNGKRGFISGKLLKYAFYLFYPVHLMALVLIRKYLM